MSQTFLIIQTAFTGDAILATSLAEKLYETNREFKIDVLVRKGNEGLLLNHPFIREILVWDKKRKKYSDLIRIISEVRKKKYDVVFNLQRFMSTGIITSFSGAKQKIGYNKNPLSILFTKRVSHQIQKGIHEIDRNQAMAADFTSGSAARPRLYPTSGDFMNVQHLKHVPYMTISPASVWFTKTLPAYKWVELIREWQTKKPDLKFYLLGSNDEFGYSESIREKSDDQIINLCGKLTLLESAALMKDAAMNYSNDSAPMHLASAMNAPVSAVYCSTVPDFGFGPLSDNSRIIESVVPLSCRPCGLHGYKQCPLSHFKCAHSIQITEAAHEGIF